MSKIIFLIASPILKSLLDRVDPSKYNGAMLLGLNGIVVKSHGGSKAEGFANAISVAYDLCVNDFNQKIIVDIKNNLKLSRNKLACGKNRFFSRSPKNGFDLSPSSEGVRSSYSQDLKYS